MKKKYAVVAAALMLAVVTVTGAFAGGIFPSFNGQSSMPLSYPSGNELMPMDTALPSGVAPQTITPTLHQLLLGKVTTDSDVTNPVAEASGIAGAALVHYRLTGAPTTNQTLTLPTVALTYAYLNAAGYVASFPSCWFVKFVNVGGTSSGTFTVTTATGWGTVTTNGNVVVPVAGSRLSRLCLDSATAGTVYDYGN